VSSGFLTKNVYFSNLIMFVCHFCMNNFYLNINIVRQKERILKLLIICLPLCHYCNYVMYKPRLLCIDSVLIAGVCCWVL
jgi:hypothetical protein